MRDLIHQVTESFIYHIDEKGLKLKVKIDENVPQKILSDPQRLSQIISNILWNAIKYTQKGYIYLHVQVDPLFKNNTASNDDKIWKCLQISVRDTGRGIELENIGKLFTLFG